MKRCKRWHDCLCGLNLEYACVPIDIDNSASRFGESGNREYAGRATERIGQAKGSLGKAMVSL